MCAAIPCGCEKCDAAARSDVCAQQCVKTIRFGKRFFGGEGVERFAERLFKFGIEVESFGKHRADSAIRLREEHRVFFQIFFHTTISR